MSKYNLFLRILHWIIGILVIFIIILGYNMGSLPSVVVAEAYKVHKAVGVTILFLMVVRLFVRIFTKNPVFPQASSRINRVLDIFSRVVHFTFYVVIIVAATSGYVMSSASGKPVKWFFDIDVPLIIDKHPEVASKSKKIHLVMPIIILGLLLLHILGFIKHLIIDKENILKRIV